MGKITYIADKLSGELSKICDCYLPTDYIGDTRMICNEDNPNNVVLQGRLISIYGRSVSELMQDLTQWVSTAPHVVVQGVQLVAEMNCSIELSELGDSKCTVIQDKDHMKVSQDTNASDPPTVGIVAGGIATVMLLALIIVTVCGILVLRRKMM